MSNIKNILGKKYGKWHVLGRVGSNNRGDALWKCQCECGTIKLVSGVALRCEQSGSCGCEKYLFTKKHGMYGTATYRSWQHAISRCTNPNDDAYSLYGGIGIKVCERWLGENGFSNFVSDVGIRPKGKSIDRFPNSNGNYEPNNIRWATPTEQVRNSKTPKLNMQMAQEIRNRYSMGGITQKQLSIRFGVTRSNISFILNYKQWI